VDAETLQAQVDKSVARVQEIVSSWMKPYKGSNEASKAKELVEKDIEFYSARPAHLGVGATYEPSKTDVRGVARLRGRLMQKHQKPDPSHGPSGVQAAEKDSVSNDEDDTDSRASIFAKKAKAQQGAVDKFSSKSKKKIAAAASSSTSASLEAGNDTENTRKGTKTINDSPDGSNAQKSASKSDSSQGERSPGSPSMPPPSIVTSGIVKSTSFNLQSPHASNGNAHGSMLFKHPSFDSPHPLSAEENSEEESVSNLDQRRSSSPKRKRKRRKKKHNPDQNHSEPQGTPTALHIQLPENRFHLPSPSPGAESATPSESVATAPPLSALPSRANSREGSQGRSESASQEDPQTDSPLPTSYSFTFTSPIKRSGMSARRKQLYEKIIAKERQNAAARN